MTERNFDLIAPDYHADTKTDERLAALERDMREVRLNLGLALPSTPEEMKAMGVVGVIDSETAAVRPNQTLEEIPAINRLMRMQAASALPDLTPEEALAHYAAGERGVPMLFPEPIRLLDPSDHHWISWTTGWHRVPQKHVATLEGRKVVKIPPEMLAGERPLPTVRKQP